ncbi:GH25 family lysozyme [Kitasatospora cathayae]|uniref:GH25 family lysozyme n=1 Tax=Kitasatospora cathayae TaxID=3004092 RepID=A0ABY7QAI6_9ACTN|nr:GH25 family lysozyme [Kitasatospora sp. HUAS 3-15]WBP89546.1 GH25 family lysozyme [Kitasatospora sp. HUAS 3-15]
MANARGYDVSDYQSSIPDDAEFVIVKASEGARTEQTGYAAKVAEARRRTIIVGHYHFIHCENDVQGEIDHFCRVVGPVPAGELLVLDFEPYGQPVSDSSATAAKNAWLTAVKRRYPNNRVGLYTSVDWWHRTDDNAGDFLWIADYVPAGSPRIQAAWKFHQWTDSPLDSDVYNGTIDDLRAWAGSAAPAPSAPASPTPWPGLQLVTRDQWGARPWREPNGSIPYAGPRAGVKVHYLGTQYQFGAHDTCPAYVRKIQAEHMDGNGWSDIGYSFVVCEHGVVFEGRGLTRRNSANGDVPLNEAHYAVCALLGDSGSTEPTPEQLQGLRDAIEYCQQHGPAGLEVKGHRDGYSTDCPGGPLYAWVQAGAPRPTLTAPLEDDMPLSDDDVARIAHVIWNYEVPVPRLQPDGTVTYPTSQAAYWPLVWGNVWTPQILAAIKAAALTPEQVSAALADGTLHVQVTVAPAAAPASTTASTAPTS